MRLGLFRSISILADVPREPPPFEGGEHGGLFLIGIISSLFWLLSTAFTIWMIVECLRKDPDRFLWLWLIVVLPGVGPVIYFFVRWLPQNQVRPPQSLRRWTRGRELRQLETAARQIGNPHQFVQWGDALFEIQQLDKAASAYGQALEREADNLPALWGAAQIDLNKKDFEPARNRLARILDLSPEYKFGDVSLAFGKSLAGLGQRRKALEHLQTHVKRWRHPEALFLLAQLEEDEGNLASARDHLEALLLDIEGSPRGIARKYGIWKSRAKKMLRRLG